MKQLATYFFRNSEKLSLRLLFWILLLSTLLALVATTIQLYTDYRDSRQSLELSLHKVEITALPAVAVAMWKLDKEVMESILSGLLTQSGFLYAEVADTYGNSVTELGTADAQSSFERTYPIMFTNDVGQQVLIGQLKITATLDEIYRQLIDKTLIILLTQGIKTFFMSICILILVERMIIRHLNVLANWASTVDLANPDQFLQLPHRKSGEEDAIGKVNMAINLMQSNLIKALAERERTERLIRSIIDNTPALICAKDRDGCYTMVNQEFLKTFGLDYEQVIGHTSSELFPEMAAKLQQHDRIVTEQGEPFIFEEEVLQPDGQIDYYMSVKFPIFDDHGKLSGIGGVLTNITDRRNKEQQIIELNEGLEQKVRERTKELEVSLSHLKETQDQLIESEKMSALGNLVAGVAHEINTPLGVSVTATSHLSELFTAFQKEYESGQLQRASLERVLETTQESLHILEHNLNRAIVLIKNFKQVAVDQSSEIKRQFELGAYLEEISQSLKPQLKIGGHSITIQADEQILLNSYPGALAQVMTNLIMNSVNHGFKHRTGGNISIKLTVGDHEVCIDYQDNGSGLDAIQREKVFEPFYTTARGYGGSGLGMSISYNLVISQLGGRISCLESESGAYFKIILPITL